VTWLASTNTSAGNGRSTGAATIVQCLNDCHLITDCTAVDWDAGESEGRRCSLHGHWSTDALQNKSGVLHFVIERPACGQVFVALFDCQFCYYIIGEQHMSENVRRKKVKYFRKDV